MAHLTQTCRISGKQFIVSDEDQAMLSKLSPVLNGKKYDLPLPTLCPEERQRRRMAFRNDRTLYYRKCDLTDKQILSQYPSECAYTIYDANIYWTDKWDPMRYGHDFDFSRPFFEQFEEFLKTVPRISVNGLNNENCDFTSFAGWSKNCYLTCTADYNEDCYYIYYALKNNDCCDACFITESQLCYECTDVKKCYHCLYSQNLTNSSDCILSRDLIGCQNCFGCIGLRNKQYYYFNEKLSPEEWQQKVDAWNLHSAIGLNNARNEIAKFFLQFPRRAVETTGSENVLGDYVFFSQNCYHCFDVKESQDLRYCSHIINAKDSMDWDYYGSDGELCYEMQSSAGGVKNCAFSTNCWGNDSYLLYCDLCTKSKNCFGCIGLRNAEYCIFNKQYSKEEYFEMVDRIIEHMKRKPLPSGQANEWGEFFPANLSPHAYNESVATDYYPLTKEGILSQGFRFEEVGYTSDYQGVVPSTPDNINDIDESICKQILKCETSEKLFKIIPQEFRFYKNNEIPIPRRSPEQRYKDRMNLRNPRVIFDRNCAKCAAPMQTTFAPDRPEIVYCEKCYLENVN
ncbi:MAG: hypothetical protein Q8P68_00595 [Candidatus Peregrinibacteria bacterium]|nr:hypothetical protein [Candidatus Peregrinibacteria bacterium]MDZ4245199.1 hypothetical protein [Candidatus Gracilibacteria bacterium]